MARKSQKVKRIHRRAHRRRKLASRWERSLGICFGIILAAVCIGLLQQRLYPVFEAEAAAQLHGEIRESMERMICDEVLCIFPYDALVTLERDQAGRIAAVATNTREENRLKNEVARCVGELLAGMEETRLKLPLSRLTSLVPSAAPALRLPMRIECGGPVRAALLRDVEEFGINQSRLRLRLTVEVPLRAVFSKHVLEDTVSMEFLVGETVIVGSAPNTYFQF